MTTPRPAFLFLAANTPWVYALAHSLEPHGKVTVVRMIDWLNNLRIKPQWPETESAIRRRALTMLPGYAGRFAAAMRPLLRSIIDKEREMLRRAAGSEPYVVCPYPFIAPWVRHVRGDRLIYYNLDDYSLYDVRRSSRTRELEDELIERAALTICLSFQQTAALRTRHPGRAHSIRHFPLGVQEVFLNPDPLSPAHPTTVGYVGNMTDRVDWHLVREVAQAMPEVRFHLVGNVEVRLSQANLQKDPAWETHRKAVLALPNVVVEGPVSQADVRLHYWKYAVNWMPYDACHPFNIASCPTKIMDALASGRPFVSTDIPESRQYPGRVHVVADSTAAVATIQSLLDARRPHNAAGQVRFAAANTWSYRACELLSLLEAA